MLGAILGGLGGLLGGIAGGSGGEGKSAKNYYADNKSYGTEGLQSHIGQALAGAPTYEGATGQVQSNPLLGQLFGQNGTLSRTANEEKDLASRGYSLQPEDHEAYGQGAGNIARMFGQQEQGLSQSLANRGLSNSGVAGAAFSGLQGNKMEQLGGLQRQIADDRMKMNMQRLGQTRNFLSQMGQQAQGAMGQAFNQDLQGNQQLYDMNKGMLDSQQNQANEEIQQKQQTKSNPAASGIGGALSGLSSGIGLYDSAKKAGIF